MSCLSPSWSSRLQPDVVIRLMFARVESDIPGSPLVVTLNRLAQHVKGLRFATDDLCHSQNSIFNRWPARCSVWPCWLYCSALHADICWIVPASVYEYENCRMRFTVTAEGVVKDTPVLCTRCCHGKWWRDSLSNLEVSTNPPCDSRFCGLHHTCLQNTDLTLLDNNKVRTGLACFPRHTSDKNSWVSQWSFFLLLNLLLLLLQCSFVVASCMLCVWLYVAVLLR